MLFYVLGKIDQAASIVSISEKSLKEHPEKQLSQGAQLQKILLQYRYGVENYILTSAKSSLSGKFGRFYDELGWEFEAGESYRRRDMIRFGHFTKAKMVIS